MMNPIPERVLEDLRRLCSDKRTGTILLHMKDGVVLRAELQSKVALGVCSTPDELTVVLAVR